jgi:cobalamin biosynthesis protein CobT
MGDSELERLEREAGSATSEIQNRMIANRLGLLSSMLTGDDMRVKVSPLHDNRIGYIQRNNIIINATRLAGKDINTKFMVAKGLVIHECCHKLFDYSIPLINYKKAEGLTEDEVEDLVYKLKQGYIFYSHNVLEDQRIETLLTNLYPNSAPYLRIPIYEVFLSGIKKEFTAEKIMAAKTNALIMLWGRKYIPVEIREGLRYDVLKSPEVDHKDIILKILDLINVYIQLDSKNVKKQIELAEQFHELSNEMNGIKIIKTENIGDSIFKHRETKQEKKLRDDAEEILKKQVEKETKEQKKETPVSNDREIEDNDDEVEEKSDEGAISPIPGKIINDIDTIIEKIKREAGLPAVGSINNGENKEEPSKEDNEDSEEVEEQEDNEDDYNEDDEGLDNDEDSEESGPTDMISVGRDPTGRLKDNTSTKDIGSAIGDAMVEDIEQVESEVKMDVRRILETTPPPFTLSYLDIQMSKMLRKKLEQLTSGLQEETSYGQRSGRVHMKAAKTADITHSTRIFKRRLPDESNKAKMAVSILVDGSGSMGSVSANKSKMNAAVRTCFIISNELERMGNYVEARGFGDNDVLVKAFGQKHADWGDENWGKTGYGNGDTHSSIIAARENLIEISTKNDFKTKVLMLFGDGAWADNSEVEKEIMECNKKGIITVFMKYDDANRMTYKLQKWEQKGCKLGEYIPVRKINECLVKSVQRIISEVEKEVVKVIMQCRQM